MRLNEPKLNYAPQKKKKMLKKFSQHPSTQLLSVQIISTSESCNPINKLKKTFETHNQVEKFNFSRHFWHLCEIWIEAIRRAGAQDRNFG